MYPIMFPFCFECQKDKHLVLCTIAIVPLDFVVWDDYGSHHYLSVVIVQMMLQFCYV